MKKKTGFTLIELLAVIVILAVIALIAVPVIMDILNKSNKSAFKDTAYGILSAGELYFAEQQLELNGMSEGKTFILPSKEIQIKGNVPEGTILKVNTKGEIALIMRNGRYCITKKYDENDITVSEDLTACVGISGGSGSNDSGNTGGNTLSDLAVISTELGVDSIDACAISGTCEAGTAFAIQVNDDTIEKFYVISDNANEITLILNRNLYDDTNITSSDVAWCDNSETNKYGPITALSTLKERTLSWINIPERTYITKGLNNSEQQVYTDIVEIARARMLTYEEATSEALGCIAWDYGCKEWVYENFDNTNGYWLSTPIVGSDSNSWAIRFGGRVYNGRVNYTDYGVRPVIEISK